MGSEYLYGRRPVLEALRAGRRRVKRLVIAESVRDSEGVQQITGRAGALRIPIEAAPRDRIDAQTGGANHQGVTLEAGPYPYVTLEEVLDYAVECGQPPLLLLLDLIQDVQNVGTLLRTAEAVGVHGVVLQERRAASITPAVVSASSGAVEHLNIARVTNLVRAMTTLQGKDLWLAGLDTGSDAVRYDQADLRGALGLVVGSEGKGLRRLVRETCDFIVSLPMQGQIESLNASIAGSLALYAAWQARGFTRNDEPGRA